MTGCKFLKRLRGRSAMIDPNSGDYQVQVRMPTSMCMLKLRAFVQDLGGKIVDTGAAQPGGVHFRLRAGGKSAPAWSVPGSDSWSGVGAGSTGGAKTAPSGLDLDMELRVTRPDLKQPENLTISLHLRAAHNAWAVSRRELKEHYEKIVRELKAYLQATTTSPGDFVPGSY
jgi:hypothetical protein